ncbi:SIMPL domain-containing protein [Pseudoduganella ginsengisoli]|uniref:DUF541 domain-containing protein n=1 Tax=Pseudoduganella ginsengisoli TaxID=1462440 RepID=A0A6L6PX35_9BURK|nr:SIMPL domain-containing protein [Pseudoduganella ginsengisoli]MTW02163.1 DUF541 domain-containing protein [Pseudoduganella ginsengisoli]
MTFRKNLLAATLLLATQAYAQTTPPSGTEVIVAANGEVTAPNDQAVVTMAIEEQDKDKAAAASRVNLKMKQGMEILRKEDPTAAMKTQGYYTYPVYPEERPLPPGAAPKVRQPAAWRVGQYLQVTTTSLDKLPKTVASAQKILTLNGISFGLSRVATKKLDEQRIAATYQNLQERIAAISRAMGRNPADALLETVDFEGSGNYAGGNASFARSQPMMMKGAAPAQEMAVEEPSFEPGETTLNMHLVGKVRFK